jgi:hypothetical protein
LQLQLQSSTVQYYNSGVCFIQHLLLLITVMGASIMIQGLCQLMLLLLGTHASAYATAAGCGGGAAGLHCSMSFRSSCHCTTTTAQHEDLLRPSHQLISAAAAATTATEAAEARFLQTIQGAS